MVGQQPRKFLTTQVHQESIYRKKKF